MDATSAEAARTDLRRLLNVAHYQGRPTVITKFGQDWAAIAPLTSLHTAQTAPQLQAQLAHEQQRSTTLQATCAQQADALARGLIPPCGAATHRCGSARDDRRRTPESRMSQKSPHA